MSSDFFLRPGPSVLDATDNQASFADALRARFGANGVQVVTGHEFFPSTSTTPQPESTASMMMSSKPGSAGLAFPPPKRSALPKLPSMKLPTLPTSSTGHIISTAGTSSSNLQLSSELSFEPTKAEHLPAWFSDPHAIIIDLRSHAQYANARLPRAIFLSVPSTLLKRPAFPLSKLANMLPSHARARLMQWQTASRVMLYDADGAPPTQGSNISGLLRKFVAEGCPTSKLSWLDGGFQNVWRHHRELVDSDPPSDDDDEASGNEDDPPQSGLLRARQLPAAAFTASSTTGSRGAIAASSHSNAPQSAPQVAFNPFYDAIRQNLELSHGITERINLRLAPHVLERVDELPFRWLRDVARYAGEIRPRTISIDARQPRDTTIDEGAESLAMQFYRIELAEQRRLTGIMQHHSQHDSGTRKTDDKAAVPFPFSITAGVEKGAKNRYRNIWPFEHSRVHLHTRKAGDDDYINASYIQPLGTDKRYIATQGPLPATFDDFWALVWEQNVHILVMLTKEIEGAMIKCGKYWVDGDYGPLRLRLLSTTGGTPAQESDVLKPSTGVAGFFTPAEPAQHTGPTTIRRTFELTHSRYPDAKPRIVTQFQYLEWPDMNVPDSPAGLLDLIDSVRRTAMDVDVDATEEAQRAALEPTWDSSEDGPVGKYTGIARHALGNRPVLLHCSAGVGRTGGFIAVDAVLDGIRRELSSQISDVNDMAIDSTDELDGDYQSVGGLDMPMDLDAPTGSLGPRSELKKGSLRTPSPRKSRRSSAGAAWVKNDPRRMPLRKWLAATGDVSVKEAQNPSPPSSASVTTATPLANPVPVRATDMALPPPSAVSPLNHSGSSASPPFPLMHHDEEGTSKTSPLQPAFQLLLPDLHRARTASAPSSSAGATARRLATHLNIDGPKGSSQLSSTVNSSTDVPSTLFSSSEPRTSSSSLITTPASSLKAGSARSQPSLAPTTTFDYTTPRALHTQNKPCLLSSLSEPIRTVIEDIREQRMSLCQSLRQYVFVHQAIIEGALRIVDEIRSGADGRQPTAAVNDVKTSPTTSPSPPNKAKRRHSTMDADNVYDHSHAGATLSKRPSIKRVTDTSSTRA